MSSKSAKLPSPGRRNSPESYQLAVKEIEQEKQMVAALKRLSIGHMMNHDPDLPMADPELHIFHDPDHHDDLTFSGDSLSLSKSPSPQTSDSTLALVTNKDTAEHASTIPARRSRSSSHELPDLENRQSQGEETLDADLLWLPANVHPEVNPQQFKSHVKNTIDELLERKLSRSKSANRSKRLSLSLSTTDQNYLSHALNERSAPRNDYETPGNRYSNPSLRELSSELEMLSRMAGMDSNDAVTIARSLSTSSLGYTDVEKLAFDELGQPSHGSPSLNQAELLDFGVEETLPTRRKSYGMAGLPMGLPPAFQGYPQHLRQRRASPTQQHYQQARQGGDHMPSGRSQQPNDEFALKRSRRLDYRKGPTSTPTQLGSQLQNHKAEKLAELRHNLSGTLTPLSSSSSDLLSVTRSSRSASRLSIQSINPRSSQILFSYKTPGSPAGSRPQTAPARSGDWPYLSALNASSTSLASQNYRQAAPYKHGHKHRPAQGQPLPQGVPPGQQQLHQTPQGQHHGGQAYPQQGQQGPYDVGRKLSGGAYADGRQHHAHHRQRQRQVSPQTANGPYPYLNQSHGPIGSPAHGQNLPNASGVQNGPITGAVQLGPNGSPVQANAQLHQGPNYYPQHGRGHKPQHRVHGSGSGTRPRQHSDEQRRPKYASGSLSKRDKSRELNQNLDLLRNEINEFKESLSKTEPKAATVKETPKPVEQTQEAVPDISFDLTSHDVSYEDSLGMETDVLKQLDAEKAKTPEASPKTSPKKTPKKNRMDMYSQFTLNTESQSSPPHGIKATTSSVANDRPEESVLKNEVEPQARKESIPQIIDEIPLMVPSPREESLPEPDHQLVEEIPEESLEVIAHAEPKDEIKSDYTINKNELKAEKVRPGLKPSSKLEDSSEVPDPLAGAPLKVDTKLKKNRSATSLAKAEPEKKKSGKKSWLWSKDRSVSATSTTPQQKEFNVPARSVSSPEIATKREATKRDEPSGKENVITKLFKKKRSNSVSTERPHSQTSPRQLLSETSELAEVATNDLKSRSSMKSTHSRDSAKDEPKAESRHSDTFSRKKDTHKEAKGEEKVTSRIKNKFKQMGKSHDEKSEPVADELIPEVNEEEEAKDAEDKPQSTLEVQEKLKKSIKRTSKPNQPIEFTDSAFGFPLPPPSHSTLVMIDYRFPVHVERAIYRLSHLKLANPKRSLREQVLLSNFMYAYLNLVDHTLHLEQQMELEESLEQPEADMDMFAADEEDTEFETDDELNDSEFDSIKLDFDVQDTQITA